MVRRRVALLCALLAVGAARPAAAQPAPLEIAVYAPWSGPSTADQRYALSLAIEDAVRRDSGRPVKVSSFAKRADFVRAVSSGRIAIAVVDAGAASLAGRRLKVVSSWSSGQRWLLMSTTRHRSLRNLRLALQAGDAPSSQATVRRLLRGQVTASYWSSTVAAPVTADAKQLVLRGLADVVLLPAPAADDLVELADLGSFGELALAVDARVAGAPDAVPQVQAAVRRELGGSWAVGAPRFPRSVGLRALTTTPMKPRERQLLQLLAPLPSRIPNLPIDELWIEPNAP